MNTIISNVFPSPCGVLVLKVRRPSSAITQTTGFRPLAGFWFLKETASTIAPHTRSMFPSPCGVLVLKGKEELRSFDRVARGFRPLAGFWFLK